ncbi:MULTISPECIES: globin [unclassified Frondihabitans]|jgi:hemoglobin|uniref:globin n=1 Tax=unclassified Frondihabitans TaxID=2626248 RepID=UPI0009FEAE5E|nr:MULTISPECIES: globin [unclassified Frondihabitans]MBF4576687.1 globin [Frondihabitans sp. VKM Ac-2883]RPE76448.1 hemoglobin [Frondihabitans sp. PhB153]RPF05276.1 hemoglobin [Frondihabitans sp. PhB161]
MTETHPVSSGEPVDPQRSLPLGQPVTLRSGRGDDDAQGNFWVKVGGRPTFEKLVRRFYEGVQTDPIIWPMYPADDLEGAIQRLTGFLEQYWGGPTTYSDERGHPRLRMRHNPFTITPAARDRWLVHMRDAVDSLDLAPLDDAMLWGYLDRAAHAMVNSFAE